MVYNISRIACLLNATCQNVSHSGRPMFLGTPEAFLVPALFLVIFVVGILGNGGLIFIVARNANMRNVPNILIVNLAAGDLILILVSVPFTATIYTLPEWPYGEPICRLNEFLCCMSLGVSVFTLIALSLDRYVAIAHPLSRRKSSPVCRTASVAVAIWLLSILLSIPVAVVSHIEYYPDGPSGETVGVCIRQSQYWGEPYARWQAVFNFVVFFAVPMLIIFVFYALMARTLIASSSSIPGCGNTSTAGRAQTESRNKVARLILSFVAVFVLCWLPRHVYVLWYYFSPGEYNMFWHVFKIVGFCMSFINSCVNPLALYYLSQQFRRHYNNILCCCCHSYRRRSTVSNTESFIARHKMRLIATRSRSSERCDELTSFTTMNFATRPYMSQSGQRIPPGLAANEVPLIVRDINADTTDAVGKTYDML